MAIVSDFTNTWSSAVTLTTAEFWQVRKGPVYIATAATSEPSDEKDGLLLDAGDVLALSSGDVVRYRSARPEGDGEVVRRAKV